MEPVRRVHKTEIDPPPRTEVVQHVHIRQPVDPTLASTIVREDAQRTTRPFMVRCEPSDCRGAFGYPGNGIQNDVGYPRGELTEGRWCATGMDDSDFLQARQGIQIVAVEQALDGERPQGGRDVELSDCREVEGGSDDFQHI